MPTCRGAASGSLSDAWREVTAEYIALYQFFKLAAWLRSEACSVVARACGQWRVSHLPDASSNAACCLSASVGGGSNDAETM